LYLGADSGTVIFDNVSVKEIGPAVIKTRSYATGASTTVGITPNGLLRCDAYDGTNTRTTITDSAYNTNSWIKVEAVYTPSDTALAIRVNGQTVKSTTGTALLSMNNSNAQLTIGNNFDLNAPFPGSIALAKLSATAPTADQSLWMYEQEKHMFSDNSLITLPDSGSLIDLAVEDGTSRLLAISQSNESYWSGLRRVKTEAVSAGTYSKLAATDAVHLAARITTDAGVDITIPAYNIKTKLEQDKSDVTLKSTVVFDFDPVDNSQTAFVLPIGFTALAVYKAGVELRETITTAKDWSRSFDGFKETITLSTAPGTTNWIQIHATKE
jgi:Concanavalin A-like lectin/glucanases superfamily